MQQRSQRSTLSPYTTLFRSFGAFVGRARAVRRLGSAAIDLCWVAAGRMDGFWESDLKPWDIAGGALIVAEAGRSEEHTSELQSRLHLVCRLLLEKKNIRNTS